MPPLSIARERSLYAAGAERALPALRHDLAGLREQLSTGKRINRPSDDPAGFAQARALEALERRHEQHARAIGDARLWTDRTQSAIDGLAERFTDAYAEGIRALNDTLNQDDRNAIAQRVDTLLAEVIDGLNAKSGEEYLFGGTRTTTPPLQPDGTLTGSADTPPVTLADLGGKRNREIAPGVTLAVNVSGADLLQTDDDVGLVESLQRLAAALRAEPTAPPLRDAVEEVGAARDHLLERGAEAGNIAHRLNLAEAQLAEASLEAARRRSEVEDADYFAVVTELQSAQTTLEAALRATAKAAQTTLLDFLR